MRFKWSGNFGTNPAVALQGLPRILKKEIMTYLFGDLLRTVPLFKHAPYRVITSLVVDLQMEFVTRGDFVFRKGQVSRGMYWVSQGQIAVTAELRLDTMAYALFQEGDFFGEEEIMVLCQRLYQSTEGPDPLVNVDASHHIYRKASAWALWPCRVLFLSNECLLRTLRIFPDFAQRLIKHTVRRQKEMALLQQA